MDDDTSLVRYVTDFLTRQRISVVSAVDGATGAALARGEVFDAVILDQRLPDGNGLAVLKEFRAAGVGVPVMVLTAFPAADEAFKAARLGAVTYHQKPLIGVKLLQAVWATVDGGRSSTMLNRDHALSRELLLETAVALRGGSLPPDLASRLVGFLAEAGEDFLEFVALAAACRALVSAGRDIGDARGMVERTLSAIGSDRQDPRVQQIVRVIEESGATWSRITARATAEAVGISQATLWRILDTALAMSFIDVRRAIVVKDGLQRLAQSREHVRQIAFQVGYRSHSQFDRDVVAVVGLTPSEFRSMAAGVSTRP